ncbi:MAG: hypothetical protein CMM22_00425 [Rhodospirillaceae bacterium]|jgi:membrane dipeptidase|nr:hypothetical protein [Rhodospirillaceae bacterium]|tara:strand:+ start:232 stop:1407 length:1176 start_codon:yes stop_codon:yes gene_type:complete
MFDLTKEQEERAMRLHEETIVVDGLGLESVMIAIEQYSPNMLKRLESLENVPAGRAIGVAYEDIDRIYMEEQRTGESSIEREWIEASGVDVFGTTVANPLLDMSSFEDTVKGVALWQRRIDCLDYLVKATCIKDIEEAKAAGKRAVIMGLQGADCLGGDLDRLQVFYDLGVRMIQPTYNTANLFGGGCLEPAGGGLSILGKDLVKRMNEMGILIDVSHCGDQTTSDVIEVSDAPVIITHAASRRVYNHPRHKTDEQLQALSAKDGLIAVQALPHVILDMSQEEPTIDAFLDHIDHIVEVMGADKVGVGTDWPGMVPKLAVIKIIEWIAGAGLEKKEVDRMVPGIDKEYQGFKDRREWPNITRGLVSRGYNDDEIRGIIGDNFLRIFKEVVG